jgi:hypothetical protein
MMSKARALNLREGEEVSGKKARERAEKAHQSSDSTTAKPSSCLLSYFLTLTEGLFAAWSERASHFLNKILTVDMM